MAADSLAELFEVMGRGEMDAVIGTPEGPWLDFKSQAYKLDTPAGVADMAADVAAFANTGYGVLLLVKRCLQCRRAGLRRRQGPRAR